MEGSYGFQDTSIDLVIEYSVLIMRSLHEYVLEVSWAVRGVPNLAEIPAERLVEKYRDHKAYLQVYEARMIVSRVYPSADFLLGAVILVKDVFSYIFVSADRDQTDIFSSHHRINKCVACHYDIVKCLDLIESAKKYVRAWLESTRYRRCVLRYCIHTHVHFSCTHMQTPKYWCNKVIYTSLQQPSSLCVTQSPTYLFVHVFIQVHRACCVQENTSRILLHVIVCYSTKTWVIFHACIHMYFDA
jgi:hypothetical protein